MQGYCSGISLAAGHLQEYTFFQHKIQSVHESTSLSRTWQKMVLLMFSSNFLTEESKQLYNASTVHIPPSPDTDQYISKTIANFETWECVTQCLEPMLGAAAAQWVELVTLLAVQLTPAVNMLYCVLARNWPKNAPNAVRLVCKCNVNGWMLQTVWVIWTLKVRVP